VKSSSSKNKIRSFFKKQDREQNIEKGRLQVEEEIKSNGYKLEEAFDEKSVEVVLDRYNLREINDLFAMVEFGGDTAQQIANRLTNHLKKQQEKEPVFEVERTKDYKKVHSDTGVIVEGLGGMLVSLAKCCNPVPGDDIVDRKSTRLNSSHVSISYAVFCYLHTTNLYSVPTRRSSDLQQIANRLTNHLKKQQEKEPVFEVERTKDYKKVHSDTGVIVEGLGGMLVSLAKCCNPVPGDDI